MIEMRLLVCQLLQNLLSKLQSHCQLLSADSSCRVYLRILLCLQNVGRIASKSSEPLILYSQSFTWCRNNANAPNFSDKVQCKKLNHKKQDDVSWKLSIGPTYVTIYLSWVIYHAWSLLNQTRSNKVFAFEIVPVPYKPDAVKRRLVISVSEYSSGLLFTSWFTKSGCNGVW